LTQQSSAKIYALSAMACALIAWNYWIPTFLYSPSAVRYGSGFPDFNLFYLAGHAILTHTEITRFIYPPPSLPFYEFFALFNIDLASWLWMMTYLIVFIAAVAGLALTIGGVRRAYFVSLTGVLAFTSFPLLIMMNLGQVDLLVASLSILSLAMQRLEHENASAILLSCATLLKGPPLLLLIYFSLYRKDLRYFLRFIVVTIVIVAASLIVVPLNIYARYFGTVAPKVSVVSPSSLNQSLLSYTSSTLFSAVVIIAGVIVLSVFTLWVTSKKFRMTVTDPLRDDGMFLLNVLVILLLSPRTWPGTYVWIILPVALFLSNLLQGKVKILYLTAVCFDTVLLNANLSQLFLQFSTYDILPLAISGNIMLTLILALSLLRPSVAHTKE